MYFLGSSVISLRQQWVLAMEVGWSVCCWLKESAKSKTCIIIHLQFELCDNVACRVNVDVHIVAVFIANALPAIATSGRLHFTTSRTKPDKTADVVPDPAAVRARALKRRASCSTSKSLVSMLNLARQVSARSGFRNGLLDAPPELEKNISWMFGARMDLL